MTSRRRPVPRRPVRAPAPLHRREPPDAAWTETTAVAPRSTRRRSGLGDRLHDHVDHALGVLVDQEVVVVHRVADPSTFELLADRRELVDGPSTGVDAHHASQSTTVPT